MASSCSGRLLMGAMGAMACMRCILYAKCKKVYRAGFSMSRNAGRHFLQIPGPTNVPDRVLRAIDFPTMDHRGPEFAGLGKAVFSGMKQVFKSAEGEVVIYPASGTGAWEAALVNTLSAGDRVLMAETGHFATLWQSMAARLCLDVEFLPGD